MERKGTTNLETKRLYLRKLKLDDANEAFKNWCNDKDVSKFMMWETHKTQQETKEWLKETLKVYEDNSNYEWGIVLKETNELIGSIGVYKKEEFDGRYEIGYAISKKYWRNGYTTESLNCVMDYLVNEEGIKKFIGRHAKLNGASGSVMQKAGFVYIKDGWGEKFDKSNKFETKVYYYDVYDGIEKPKEEDSEEIAKLVISGWQTAYKGLIDEDFLNNMSIEQAKERWEQEVKDNNKVLIYRENGKILGVIKYDEGLQEKDKGEVYVLYVKPEEKRKQIGTKLFNTAKQELLKSGYKNMVVWCLVGNLVGENFYLKNGGVKTEKRKYSANGVEVEENRLLFKLRQQKEDKIILVQPTKEYEAQAIEYKEEHFKNGEHVIHACSRWDKIDSYDEWLKNVQNNFNEETVDKNWTVDSDFFAVRELDEKIVGMIDIRHELNSDFLRNYAGNIGYRSKTNRKKKRICNSNAC